MSDRKAQKLPANMAHADYHAMSEWNGEPVYGRSQVTDYMKDPQLFYRRHVLGIGRESSASASMVLGQALHEFALYGQLVTIAAIPEEIANATGKGSRTALKEWKEENAAEGYVKPAELEQIRLAGEELRRHYSADALLMSHGANELPCLGVCPVTDFWLRIRADKIIETESQVIVVDVKKTTEAGLRKFGWTVLDYGYHWQAAIYSEVIQQVYGKAVEFWFIPVVLDDVLPKVAAFRLSDDDATAAWLDVFGPGGGMERLRASIEGNEFDLPEYGEPVILNLPTRS